MSNIIALPKEIQTKKRYVIRKDGWRYEPKFERSQLNHSEPKKIRTWFNGAICHNPFIGQCIYRVYLLPLFGQYGKPRCSHLPDLGNLAKEIEKWWAKNQPKVNGEIQLNVSEKENKR